MAYNAKVELNGILGKDPRIVEKDGKTFVILRVGTKDSYPIEEEGNTIWKDKETQWHDVMVFRPYIVTIAKTLAKRDIVEISCSLEYRPFKDENGHTKHEPSLKARFIRKVELGKDAEPSEEEVAEAVEVTRG